MVVVGIGVGDVVKAFSAPLFWMFSTPWETTVPPSKVFEALKSIGMVKVSGEPAP